MRPGAFDNALGPARRRVLDALAQAVEADVAGVLGCRGELLTRAQAATAALVDGTAVLCRADARYTGVVWEHLGRLTPADRRRVLVPSALYGITTAADPIADYRLKFSVALPGVGRLDRYWSEPVTRALIKRVRNRGVVDLLPAEHARAIDWDVLADSTDVVHVTFRQADGTGAAGHAAKAAKGRFARKILTEGIEAASSFSWEGWRAIPHGTGIEVHAPR